MVIVLIIVIMITAIILNSYQKRTDRKEQERQALESGILFIKPDFTECSKMGDIYECHLKVTTNYPKRLLDATELTIRD